MITSVGENGRRLKGKMTKEPLVISCTTEELNHILDKWIGDEIVRPNSIIHFFVGSITMLSMPPRTIGPFGVSFTKSLERGP